ncbi:MAG: imidazole glycerol phosphate synthase subunit HisH [Bauldia sp.]
MTTAIIDYGAGNLRSAAKALASVSEAADSVVVTADPAAVRAADRVVLPGDGAFADCRRGLAAQPGMAEAVDAVIDSGRPFLGICVGMQLLATRGLEHGVTPGLDRLPGEVRAVVPADPALKVPHMGWNNLEGRRPHPLLEGIPLGPAGWHAYFLHGYHFVAADAGDVVAVADYGGPVTAVVARGNVAGTQFHPEKSQRLGLALLRNFVRWRP